MGTQKDAPIFQPLALPQSCWDGICSLLKLSRREADIACLILANYSESAIARQLTISPHTVHSHVDRLYRKLHIGSRCELIVRLFAAYIHIETRSRPDPSLLDSSPRQAAQPIQFLERL